MSGFWQWLGNNAGALGVIAALVPIIWSVVQYMAIKKAENRRVQFTTFHALIKQLVEPESAETPMRIDRQVAIVYELRNFKEYYPVTCRILKGLRTAWDRFKSDENGKRLLTEIDLAIKHIQRRC